MSAFPVEPRSYRVVKLQTAPLLFDDHIIASLMLHQIKINLGNL